jgi:branched-subunit amino acid ABC-type transport system permease component
MSDFLPFLVVGVVSGSVYGIASMGLVLTYKATGIFNFAHGAVAAAAAFVFYDLHHGHDVPVALAFLIAVAGFGVAAGFLLERLARRLTDAPPALTIVATVGVTLAIQGFLEWKYGVRKDLPQFLLPNGSVQIADVTVTFSQLATVAIGAVSAVLLYQLFTRSRLGLALRGVVDDPALLGLAGTSPARARRSAWMLGCTFAALSGVLTAPTLGVDAILLTLLVVQAFGAAAIGRFSSLPLAYVGGLAVGVMGALATKVTQPYPALNGAPAAVPFVVLFVVLLITRPRRLVRRAAVVRTAREYRPLPRPLQLTTAAVVAGALLAVPALAGSRLPVFINGLAFVFVFLSLGLLVWTSGQISLCQAAFVAVGAATFSHLTTADIPWMVALPLAGLATIPLGALVAVPAIRLAGIYLALATFGFGILFERVAYRFGVMFGGDGFVSAPRPELGPVNATGDRGFYYLALALVVAGSLLVLTLVRSRLGRLLRALGDSPVGLEAQGLAVNTTRVLVFCVAAFLAGIGGALLTAGIGTVSGNTLSALNSLTWLAVLAAVRTRRLVPAALLAAAALAVLPVYASDVLSSSKLTMLFGVAAVSAAIAQPRRPWVVPAGRPAERTGASPVAERARPAETEHRLLARAGGENGALR